MQLLQAGVTTQVFISRQHLCLGYVTTLSCIICISVATQKVCRDRGLLPLSLTSCCSFSLMLRHEFLVPSIFDVATQFSCRSKTLLCLAYSFCRDLVCYVATALLCIVLKSLSRHIKVCRNLVSLYLAYFCVVTLRSIHNINLSPQLEVCCNVEFLCCDQANSTNKCHLLRHRFSCRD